ncbi:MAG TPA: terpene cyclase/mutase family protein [Chloroflexi bacterium]|nr:terpene cyclase/mutase family protein [Chloroflexota bacterium]
MKRTLQALAMSILPIALVTGWLWTLTPAPVAAGTTVSAHPATIAAHGEHTGTVNTAAVVVQVDDSRTIVRWVDFTDPISGITALAASGLDVTVAETSFGPAVCAIEGVGCPADNCFCNADLFWNYNYWDGAAWQGYPVGAATSEISQTGAIEGWRWGAFGSAQTPADQSIAAASALEWLRSQQNPTTGGYGDGMSGAIEVLLALGANHERPEQWKPVDGLRSLDDYLRPRAREFSRSNVAAAGKLAVAAAAADACRPARTVKPSFYLADGMYSTDAGFNAWGMLGAAAVGEEIPASAVSALISQQTESGGWEWQAGFGADTNTTALAIQALIAAGYPADAEEVTAALAFLKSAQSETGGFVYDPKKPEYGADANSTAYVIQALLAAGEDPAGEAWTINGLTPIRFLLGLQLADGSFEWQPNTGSNLMATAQAVPALLGQAYPAAVRELEFCADRMLRRARAAATGATSETQP